MKEEVINIEIVIVKEMVSANNLLICYCLQSYILFITFAIFTIQ